MFDALCGVFFFFFCLDTNKSAHCKIIGSSVKLCVEISELLNYHLLNHKYVGGKRAEVMWGFLSLLERGKGRGTFHPRFIFYFSLPLRCTELLPACPPINLATEVVITVRSVARGDRLECLECTIQC